MRSKTVILCLCIAALVAGCTRTDQGEPAPATTDPPTESVPSTTSEEPDEDLPTDGAPTVPDPLDTSTFQEEPCRSLTSAQSQELNVGTAGKQSEDVLGNACEWSNAETHGAAIISFLDKDPRGLSALYKADKAGKWAYFEELSPIEGFPAIARAVADDRADGTCSIVVGTSDEIAFDVSLVLSLANRGKKDSCDVAAQVAGMALQTMRQGG